MSKAGKNPCPHGADILVRETKKQPPSNIYANIICQMMASAWKTKAGKRQKILEGGVQILWGAQGQSH